MSDLTWLTLVIIFFGCIIVWQLAMLMDRLGYMVGLLGDIKNAANRDVRQHAPAQPIDDRADDQQRPERPMHVSPEERQQDQVQR